MKTCNNNFQSSVFLFWSVPSISQIRDYRIKLDLLKEANSLLRSVKVITNENEILKFKKIELEEGTYYGFRKIKGELKKIALNINFIKTVIII